MATTESRESPVPSEKTLVIEYLFEKFFDPLKGEFTKTVMSLVDVQDAIRACRSSHGITLSDRNPANFMKDIVRGYNASNHWPKRLKDMRITAVQRTGEGDVFEFVPYTANQTEPFPDTYKPRPGLPEHAVQSLSMALAAKALGRSDEPWLIQTAVNLRVVETHFAVASPLHVLEITHLQMSVKLRANEIDALFMAVADRKSPGTTHQFIVTCEAKQYNERILDHQVLGQANAALIEVRSVDYVVPIGLRAHRGRGFYLVEFKPVMRETPLEKRELEVAAEAIYLLKPHVRGV